MTALRGRVVTPYEVLDDGWLAVEQGHLTGLGVGRPSGPHIDLGRSWVLPGFVDLHVHGGGGQGVTGGEVEATGRVARFHLRHGTTRMLASLVTGPVDEVRAATKCLAEWVESDQLSGVRPGPVAGLHLEGPFLSPAWCGAQDPQWMLEPDGQLMSDLVEAGRGVLRVVTLAPERRGALDLIRQLRQAGVVVAVGHTGATYAQALEAFAAGASLVTHTCNGMRPAHHREPGVPAAAFDRGGVVCEVIADGVHLHPAVIRAIVRSKGPLQVALVSDAMEAAGVGDGSYELGGRLVEVSAGVARLQSNGSLAGSTLTMDSAVRYAVAEVGLRVADVSRMASLTPARLLGIDGEVGSLEAGKRADLVVLDQHWKVQAVVTGGQVAEGADLLGAEQL